MSAARRIICSLFAAMATLIAAAGSAHAALLDLQGFRLTSPVLFVNENAGNAVITIERSDVGREAQIRYITTPITAVRGQDFEPVKSMIDFQPGQSSATFNVPIVDHGLPGLPKTIKVSLFGPSPIGLGIPSTAVLTILNNDPVAITHLLTNPLGLLSPPAGGNPLSGAVAFVDHQFNYAGVAAAQVRSRRPSDSSLLNLIASQPMPQRYGNWSGPNPGVQVSQFLERASIQAPGTIPELSTYYVVDHHYSFGPCGTHSDPSWRPGAYHRWIQSLANGIGDYRAILFLEMDSLITVGCLSHHGLQVREHELHDAIDVLTRTDPRLVIYLDAGAADAVPARETAKLLRASGVAEIQGFFVNSTHFDWTSSEIRYGRAISRLTGGKHFVVSTSANGRGPLVPANRVRDGNEVLCNPPGRGLGPKPTFHTGFKLVDAFAWIGYPGKSGGQCRPGAPPTGVFWPAMAISLARHADFRVR
jgi:endoglucanase